MAIAAYLRCSTEAQGDAFGLDAQREMISGYCQRQGIRVDEWFTDLMSGTVLERPALQELLARGSEFDTVLIAKGDRLARDTMLSLWIEKELLRSGCSIVSATEPTAGKDATTVLLRTMIAAFAQFEASQIKARTSAGRREKAKQGGYSGGAAPMGYSARRGTKRLEVDTDKAETVKRLFALRGALPSATLQELADAMNAEGLKTARGGQWFPMQVKRALDRESVYRGGYRYGGIEVEKGDHSPIL